LLGISEESGAIIRLFSLNMDWQTRHINLNLITLSSWLARHLQSRAPLLEVAGVRRVCDLEILDGAQPAHAHGRPVRH